MPDDSTRPDQPDGQQRFRADLLAYLDSLPVQPCGRVLELLDTHIGGIDQTIRVLQELRATLCGPGTPPGQAASGAKRRSSAA